MTSADHGVAGPTPGAPVDVGPGAPAAPDAGGIEQRGIDYIPLAERRGSPSDLMWMWAGAILNVEYVVYGALTVVIGLSFVQAVVVIVIGNLSFLLTGLSSLPGPQAGTTVFMISRAPFGRRGGRIVAVFNWITQVGYETLGLSLVVLAALALLGKAGIGASTGLKLALILVATVLQGVLPILGHRTMLKTLRAVTLPFIVLFVILAILAVPKAHLSGGHAAGWELVTVALALVISSSGLGWIMNASDYSRYLPTDASPRRIVASVALGGFVPSVLLMTLGAAVATAVPSASDPISGLPHAFPSWFLVPYLLFAIAQLFAINSIDLYSSGVTLQAIGLKVTRWQAILVDTVVCCGLVAATIFSSQFNSFITDFLLFVIIWIAPWMAIFLVDWAMRRGRYDSRSLLTARAGLYWRDGGFHIPGVVAQVLGMVGAAMWIDTTVYKGPLSSATNGADLSIYMGAVIAAVVYAALAWRGVRAEADATEPAQEPAGAGEDAWTYAS